MSGAGDPWDEAFLVTPRQGSGEAARAGKPTGDSWQEAVTEAINPKPIKLQSHPPGQDTLNFPPATCNLHPATFSIPFTPGRHRVLPRPGKEQGEAAEEVKPLQFEFPGAGLRKRKEEVGLENQHDHQHVHKHDERKNARPKTDDDQQGRDHLAQVNAPGNELREALFRQHVLDAAGAVYDFVDPVQQ